MLLVTKLVNTAHSISRTIQLHAINAILAMQSQRMGPVRPAVRIVLNVLIISRRLSQIVLCVLLRLS